MAIFGLLVVWFVPLGSLALNIWLWLERNRLNQKIQLLEEVKRDLEYALIGKDAPFSITSSVAL